MKAAVTDARRADRRADRQPWPWKARISAAFVAVLVVLAVVGGWVAPQDPYAQDLLARFGSPSSAHWLGTDAFGRDVLSRLIVGVRPTMLATIEAIGTAIVIGVPTGVLAGYLGHLVDGVLGRFADTLMSVPPLILAIAIVGILGPGLTNAMLAVGLVFAPRFFRVARGVAQGVRNEPYIEACRAIGCSLPRILFRHMLPNASGPLLVQATYGFGLVVIAEASLSFLGLGAQPPTASWGGMSREAFGGIAVNAFPMFPPLFMIFFTIFALSTLGDTARDRLTRDEKRVSL